MPKDITYAFNIKVAATLFIIRTNRQNNYSGVIYIDAYGTIGNVQGIDVKVENYKVSITNKLDLTRFCVGVIG